MKYLNQRVADIICIKLTIQIGEIRLTAEAIAFVVIQTLDQQTSVAMVAVRLLFNISNRYCWYDCIL